MAMQSAKDSETDKSLDAFATHVDRRFDGVEHDIREFRAAVKTGNDGLRAEMNSANDGLRVEMNGRFGEMNTRLTDLERTLRWFGGMTILVLAGALLEGRF